MHGLVIVLQVPSAWQVRKGRPTKPPGHSLTAVSKELICVQETSPSKTGGQELRLQWFSSREAQAPIELQALEGAPEYPEMQEPFATVPAGVVGQEALP